jgi:hypothetical protein
MRCSGVQGFAIAAYLERFPFPALLRVAPYCVPGGIRVVSMSSAPLASTTAFLEKGEPFRESSPQHSVSTKGFVPCASQPVGPSSLRTALRAHFAGKLWPPVSASLVVIADHLPLAAWHKPQVHDEAHPHVLSEPRTDERCRRPLLRGLVHPTFLASYFLP